MQSVIGKSKKSVQRRNHKKQNGSFSKSKPDIFKLAKAIPKSVLSFEQSLSKEETFIIAYKLAQYLKESCPKVYDELVFTSNERNLFKIISILSNAIFEHTNIKSLCWDKEQKELLFLYPINFPSYVFYLVNGRYINDLPEALKIGYAHFINAFYPYVHLSQFGQAGTEDDSLFSEIIEMYKDDMYEINDDGIANEIIEEHCLNSQQILKEFVIYGARDFKEFEEYLPKKKEFLKLKKLILDIINLKAFGIWNRFVDSEHTEGEVSFNLLFFAVTNSNDEIEYRFVDDQSNYFMEAGVTDPCGFNYITPDGIQKGTTKEDEKKLLYFLKLLTKLTEKLIMLYGK